MKLNIKLIAAVVIALIVGYGIGYVTTSTMMAPTKQPGQITEYPFGIDVGLTGQYMILAQDERDMSLLAIDDFNNFMTSTGQLYRIHAYVEDSKGTPEGALSGLTSIVEGHGAKVVLVANTFGVMAVKPYSDANNIIVISSTSTGQRAAIANDNMFRFSGPDKSIVRALAGVVKAEGFKNVLFVSQDDDLGHSREAIFAQIFGQTGIKMTSIYYGLGQPDYASEVAQMSRLVKDNKMDAVLTMTEEIGGVNIIGHAAQDPVLTSVQWFAYDTWAEAAFYPPLAPASVPEFMMKVHVLGTNYPIPTNAFAKDVLGRFQAKTGRLPSALAIGAYDGTYVAAMAIVLTGNNPGQMKTMIPQLSAHYYGVTGGPALLDENGDREFQDLDIWTVAKQGDNYVTVIVGRYTSFTDTLTMNPP